MECESSSCNGTKWLGNHVCFWSRIVENTGAVTVGCSFFGGCTVCISLTSISGLWLINLVVNSIIPTYNYDEELGSKGTGPRYGTSFLSQVVIGLEWYHEYRKCQVRWLVKWYIGQTKFSKAV